MRSVAATILLFLVPSGLAGCSGGEAKNAQWQPVAVDVAAQKCPVIPRTTLADLRVRVAAPQPPVTRSVVANWIDKMRADEARKRAAAEAVLAAYDACRSPL